MATKNNPGPFDCYKNAEPDEPMFILLGRDKHAPCLVWLWAALRELDGEDPKKVEEARQTVVAMMNWSSQLGKEVHGIGAATLVGVMEMIRAANLAVKNPPNHRTSTELVRMLLAETKMKDAE